jgi:DNA repair protein RAD7
VEGRAAAAAARRQEVASTTAGNLKTTAIPLVNWSPTRKLDGGDGSIRSQEQRRVAPSLHDICAELLCANVNHVESLGCVPESMRKMIGARLCSRRMMTAQAIGLFFEGEPVEISVPDCSLIPELELTQQMAQCSPQRLEVLELGMCGRGLSDQCLTATFATGPGALSSLTLVALRGAYRLTDKGVSALLQAAPCLTSVNLSQCSLLTEGAVKAVADCLGTQLCALSLEGCAQMDGLKLLPVLLQMPCLKKLSLSGVGGVKDEVVSELAVALGSTLEELHLADCRLLTDAAVVGVAACCLGLKVLDLDMLPLLSDMAISRLADGCRSLRVLSLKRAKFSDEAVAAFITASGSSLCEISLNSVRQVSFILQYN